MKYIIRISALAALCCVTVMQTLENKKIFIEFINDVEDFDDHGDVIEPLTVLLKQQGNVISKQNLDDDARKKKLFYFLDRGSVTVEVSHGISKKSFPAYEQN